MSFTVIIALARDVFIVLALGFVVFWIYRTGGDRVRLADLKIVQDQLTHNTQLEAGWKTEIVAAEIRREQEESELSARIDAQRAPVRLCRSPSPSPVSNPTAPAEGSHSAGGSVDRGPGKDLRPDINAFELKYENALSDCRAALASWPTAK